jgi:hypothetical protein
MVSEIIQGDEKMNKQKIENIEARELAIEYCRNIRGDIKKSKETTRPISKQIEESLRAICKIPTKENLDKYPELKAEVDKQKTLENKALITWEKEVTKVMRKNNLTEKDIKEEKE